MSRVVLALDAAVPDLSSALRALELARRIGAAELEVLLLEDERLRAIQALPVVREQHLSSGRTGRVENDRLRTELAAAARRLDLEAGRVAGELHLHWSSRSVRTRPSEALEQATAQALLLVVQRAAGPLLGAGRLRSSALQVLPEVRADVLILGAEHPLADPLVAVVTAPSQVPAVRAAARALQRVLGCPLQVLALGADAATTHALALALRSDAPGGPGGRADEVLTLGQARDGAEVVRLVAAARPGTVVLARSATAGSAAAAPWDRLDAAIWLVAA